MLTQIGQQGSSAGLSQIPALGGLVSSLTNLTSECQSLAGALNGSLTNTLCSLGGTLTNGVSAIPVLGGLLGSGGILGQTTSQLCPNGVGSGSSNSTSGLGGLGGVVSGVLGGTGLTSLTAALTQLNSLEQQAQSEVRRSLRWAVLT